MPAKTFCDDVQIMQEVQTTRAHYAVDAVAVAVAVADYSESWIEIWMRQMPVCQIYPWALYQTNPFQKSVLVIHIDLVYCCFFVTLIQELDTMVQSLGEPQLPERGHVYEDAYVFVLVMMMMISLYYSPQVESQQLPQICVWVVNPILFEHNHFHLLQK